MSPAGKMYGGKKIYIPLLAQTSGAVQILGTGNVNLPGSYTTVGGECIVVGAVFASTTDTVVVSGAGATWSAINENATGPEAYLFVGANCSAGQTKITVTDPDAEEGAICIGVFGNVATAPVNSSKKGTASGPGATTASLSYAQGDLVLGVTTCYNNVAGILAPTWSNGATTNEVDQGTDSAFRWVRLDYLLPTSSATTTLKENDGGAATASNAIAADLSPL